MGSGGIGVVFLFLALFLSHTSSSLPLCTDSRGPVKLQKPLEFCSYNGSSCCDSDQDLHLKKRFQAFNVSDPECASILKSILCSTCNEFSAELFSTNSSPKSVPVLCNSSVSTKSKLSNGGASDDFCTRVWNKCKNVSIWDSPYSQSSQDSGGGNLVSSTSSSKLIDHWKSRTSFCDIFGGSSNEAAVCFNGESVSFESEKAPPIPEGLCLEKIGNGTYINLVPHPDGSNRVFLTNQAGKIYMTEVPDVGSNDILEIAESKTFLDISNEVLMDTGSGLMGIAFHQNFEHNGRFFLSFNCDKMKQPGCFGRCSCNTEVNCDPLTLVADNGIQPCQFHNVIAEYTVNGTAPKPSMAKRANPLEVRRILTMGLPYSFHAGQILIGPLDGYLYFAMGDGSRKDDPYNFAQNKKSLLGKILRLDIDNMPSAKEINSLSLWGNYSIPKDNPYTEDKELAPEIWALGFKNPWRCSFDSERPSYFLCAESGQDTYEEVDVITKGGNYGWRVYEGPVSFHPATSPGGNTPPKSINPIFPAMGYFHSEIDKNVGSASITGGYFYRSFTDPCTYGRYVYMDLFGGALWVGSEHPLNSGNFTSARIPFKCAHDSPVKCTVIEESSLPSLGYVVALGEDNNKDVYILATSGIYRVARPSRCNFKCSKENATTYTTSRPHSSSLSSSISTNLLTNCMFLSFFLTMRFLIL